jgi:hypothetical protein
MIRETFFYLHSDGTVELSEANKKACHVWDSVDLVKRKVPQIELSVGIKNGEPDDELDVGVPEDTIRIGIRDYHVTDKETGRSFNAGLEIFLERRDLEALHAYLSFLLDARAREP